MGEKNLGLAPSPLNPEALADLAARVEAATGLDIECDLDKFAHDSGFRPREPHYITGDFKIPQPGGETLYSDEAHLWCQGCARDLLAKALRLLPKDKREEHVVYEADASTGEDGPSHCAACGHPLDHLLTEHGVESEMDHYRDHPVVEVSPAEAWIIARLVESAPDNVEVLKVGRAALLAALAKQSEGRGE